MLQWGMPQLNMQSFMPFNPCNYFAMPFIQPMANPFFSSIFLPPFNNFQRPLTNFNSFGSGNYNLCTQAQQYNFLNSGLTNPLSNVEPKPQGATSTIAELWNEGTQTIKKYAKKGYEKIKNFGHNMVNTAKKYLGYNEKNGSYKKFTQGRTEQWCADFVSYVARECGKTGFNFPTVKGIWDWGRKNGTFHTTAKVGDAIIFKGTDKKGKKVSHTGIVTSVENGVVKTIEGNTSDKVAKRSYSVNDSRITGYVTIA